MGVRSPTIDDGHMTITRHHRVRFAFAPAAVTALVLVAGACGSSDKPQARRTTPSEAASTTAAAADPNDSPYCVTARKWMVHELNGDGDAFAGDPAAFK